MEKSCIFRTKKPFIDANGRTQTPARFIGEALGATVTWDVNAKKAVFKMDGNDIGVVYWGEENIS